MMSEKRENMKKLAALFLALILLYTAALGEALPVEGTSAGSETELNTGMTFADVLEEKVLVAGPQMSRQYIENYVREHPDIIWEINDYLFVYDLVQHFTEEYPEAQNYNTYTVDENGYRVKEMDSGYCVSFHQNLSVDQPFAGYTPEEYAAMVAISLRELDTDEVNIGYFGNPEISFRCMDKEKALRFAVQHNQNSIYCVSTDETPVNPKWDGSLNPIRGV